MNYSRFFECYIVCQNVFMRFVMKKNSRTVL